MDRYDYVIRASVNQRLVNQELAFSVFLASGLELQNCVVEGLDADVFSSVTTAIFRALYQKNFVVPVAESEEWLFSTKRISEQLRPVPEF